MVFNGNYNNVIYVINDNFIKFFIVDINILNIKLYLYLYFKRYAKIN